MEGRYLGVLVLGLCCTLPVVSGQENNGSQFGNYSKENVTRENFENEFILGNKRPRDILIIVEASASIDAAGFQNIKDGLKRMLDLFCGGFGENTTNNKMAITQFSSDAVGLYSFKASQSRDDLYNAIDNLYPMYAYTCTERALTFARTVFDATNGGRFNSSSRSDTLLITDGKSNCGGNVTEAARQLREISTVWALGINVENNPGAKAEIQSIVSRNDSYHTFFLGRFSDFETMVENINETRYANGVDDPCTDLEDEAQRCIVSAWGDWSRPFGPDIDLQRRDREILVPGYHCPERAYLTQIKFENNGSQYGFHSKENVTRENFENEFVLGNKRARDILIIVDASASVDAAGLQNIKDGLKRMLDLFCGGFGENTTNNRMAFIQFSSDAVGSYSFRANQSKDDLYKAIDNLYPMYAYTCTARALTFARTVFNATNGGRFNSSSRSDTLLITDGQSNCEGNVTEAARQLREVSTVRVLGINVDDNPWARAEIHSIVSRHDPFHIFSLDRFAYFKTMVENINKTRYANGVDDPCTDIEDESTPITTTTTPTTNTPTKTTPTATTPTMTTPTTTTPTTTTPTTTTPATTTPTTTTPTMTTPTMTTPTTTTPTTTTPTTTTPTSTTLAQRCIVSAWGDWSRPYGPGGDLQRREREILVPGYVCPERANLTQMKTYYYNETEKPDSENVSLVVPVVGSVIGAAFIIVVGVFGAVCWYRHSKGGPAAERDGMSTFPELGRTDGDKATDSSDNQPPSSPTTEDETEYYEISDTTNTHEMQEMENNYDQLHPYFNEDADRQPYSQITSHPSDATTSPASDDYGNTACS